MFIDPDQFRLVITITEARPSDGPFDAEDCPAAESCQRGYEAGARSVVAGIGESLIGWWHTRWDAALAEA